MKIIFASDIHGSSKYCAKLLEAYKRENAQKLMLCGDILYHGPRNPLPEDYSPREVAAMLDGVKQDILCVRGNCDSEVDQMVLTFPLTPDYAAVFVDGLQIYLSHGHREVPPMPQGSVYITGHTHVPQSARENGCYHLNPGSVSLPKENSERGYILYENSTFYFKTLDGKVYNKLSVSVPLN